MAQNTLTVYQKGLKTFHAKKLQKSIPKRNFFISTAKDKSEAIKWGGRDYLMTLPIHYQKNWGVAGGTEGGDFGVAGQQGFNEYSIGVAHKNFNLELSGHLRDATENKPSLSYIGEALTFEMRGLQETIVSWMGSAVFGDSTGALAQVETDTGAITSTQFYVDNPGIQWLEIGMTLYASASGDKSSGGIDQLTGTLANKKITDIDEVNDRITIGDTTGLANNDYIFLAGTHGIASMNGLDAIVDDGTVQATYQGLARSGKNYTKAQMVSDSGALSETMVHSVLRRLVNFGFSDKLGHILTDPLSLDYMFLAIVDRQRFSGTSLTGGFKGLNFETPYGKIPVRADPKCQPLRMYFLDFSSFFFGWGNKTGGDWFAPGGNPVLPKTAASGSGYADAYLATWITRCQFGCTDPHSQALLSGYASP